MFYLASFVHRDIQRWNEHLHAHMDWLYRMVDDGTVAASGPVPESVGTDEIAAMILIRADDRAGAEAVLDRDPFVIHGITEDLTLRSWNPFLGAFAAETTPPSGLTR